MKTSSTQTIAVPSPLTGTTYQLHLPTNAPRASEGPTVPLVLVMDGDDQFEPALAAYEKLRAAGQVEPLLLAGIGYGASYSSPLNRRMRDYTPTAMPGEAGTGGAEVFRRALRDEIIPALEGRFAVARDERCIAGHSLGSLFGLYAFFHPERLFFRALLSAPSIWYDDRSILKIGQESSRDRRALPGRLFLCVGADDSPSMISDLELFEKSLAARPCEGLVVVSRRFAGRDHYNVLPDAFHAGLRALYGKG